MIVPQRAAETRAGWLMSAPALAAIFLFFLVPAFASLFLSLTDFDIYALADLRNLRFIGLRNYADLLHNPLFWNAFLNSARYVLFGTPLVVGMSFAAALLINHRYLRWRPVWRVILFAPYVTTLVATAVVWRYLFNTEYGLVNWMLGWVALGPIDWLGSPTASTPAILLFVAWKTFGYNMIIFLAALQLVPRELDEAARLDGAGRIGRLRHVILPAVAPAFLLVTVLTIASMFQLFAEPYVMTEGGPAQSTVTILYFMYEEGFKWWNLGSGAAVAVLLFLCICAVTLVELLLVRRNLR
ncbi:carbohydrate ABC transporter permease [Sphingosinithalassobacter portus]|uniref:carbohydrate ABC transporter permease n=1 Tax=Stakelama portus TaxID=2676234 RepID=UPI000D6DFB0F|nr:sugar ABC transporter permease [Sphingosinithalassobacter portus]